MKIKLHPRFAKSYKLRIKPNSKLVQQTYERINLFRINPSLPLLRDHGLTGTKKSLRSFSITGDIRIVYLPVSQDEIIFLDIGSHNQVY